MPLRYAIPILLGHVVLLVLAVISAQLLLQSCALPLPFLRHLSSCVTPAEIATRDRLAVSVETGALLQRRIFELERELAALQCTRLPPDPTAPLSPEGWENEDLSMLYGCWDLDTTYRTRDIDTGSIRTYDQWQMCFDEAGNGTEIMRATDGMVCEGPVTARFAGGGLSLIEPGNLPCADGGYIHHRDIACVPAPGGRASCDTLQPETNGKATVMFERAPQ